jgi:hypothetical protein
MLSDTTVAALIPFLERCTSSLPGGDTPNGSALLQSRTNEVSLSPRPGLWEMREFVLAGTGQQLLENTVKQEPDASFNDGARLAELSNQNQDALIAGTYVVPNDFDDLPFLAGRATVPTTLSWQAPSLDRQTIGPPVPLSFSNPFCPERHRRRVGCASGPRAGATGLPGYVTELGPALGCPSLLSSMQRLLSPRRSRAATGAQYI